MQDRCWPSLAPNFPKIHCFPASWCVSTGLLNCRVIVMNFISSSVGAAVGQVADARPVSMSNALRRLQQQSRAIRIAVFLALFALTAWLDFILDHDLSLFALYLIPTLYSAWYLGGKWAHGGCLAGGAVWSSADLPGWHSYHHALIPYGNLAGRLAVLTIIVAIVRSLKNALEDQYDAERRGGVGGVD